MPSACSAQRASLFAAVVAVQWRLVATVAPSASRFGGHQGGRSVGRKKVRHHVNPLRSNHQTELELQDSWPEALFDDPSRPLHIDIGCARGLFCLEAAESRPEWNVLGLEIRSILADAASEEAREAGLRNVAFLACNANVNFDVLMAGMGAHRTLGSVSIQFPDPWFKARHHKRRVVQPGLVASIAAHLPPGGWLFVQSDVLELAESMRDVIAADGALADRTPDPDGWGVAKPEPLIAVATERERSCAELGRPVYRRVYVKA